MSISRKPSEVLWAFIFSGKILVSVAVVDGLAFPILRVLRVPMPQGYIPITCLEGGFIALIGVLLLLTSLSSKVALADDSYVGFGIISHRMRFVELKGEQKHIMRKRGILMVATGLLLFVPTLAVLLSNSLP